MMSVSQIRVSVDADEALGVVECEDAERLGWVESERNDVVDVVYREFGQDNSGEVYLVLVNPQLDVRYRKLGLRLRYRWIRGRQCLTKYQDGKDEVGKRYDG